MHCTATPFLARLFPRFEQSSGSKNNLRGILTALVSGSSIKKIAPDESRRKIYPYFSPNHPDWLLGSAGIPPNPVHYVIVPRHRFIRAFPILLQLRFFCLPMIGHTMSPKREVCDRSLSIFAVLINRGMHDVQALLQGANVDGRTSIEQVKRKCQLHPKQDAVRCLASSFVDS